MQSRAERDTAQRKLDERPTERHEALAQPTATAAVLEVINSAPGTSRRCSMRCSTAAWTVRLCREAVDILMGLSGTGGLYDTADMQRFFRDAYAIAAHIMYAFEVRGTTFGQHAFGIPGLPLVL